MNSVHRFNHLNHTRICFFYIERYSIERYNILYGSGKNAGVVLLYPYPEYGIRVIITRMGYHS